MGTGSFHSTFIRGGGIGKEGKHFESIEMTLFRLKPSELAALNEPKSLSAFCKLFPDEESFYSELRTNKKDGLDESEVGEHTERYKVYGNNKIPERKIRGFFSLVWEALRDHTMLLLSFAALVSLSLGLYETFGQPAKHDIDGTKLAKVDWVEGVAIMIAVAVVVIVSAGNDYQKERQFAKLNKQKEDRDVIVIREGYEKLISIHDLVVGDLICLKTGDVVPADCVLVEGSCDCDESALTGESDTIKKVDLSRALKQYRKLVLESPHIDISIKVLGQEKVYDPLLISGSKVTGLGQAIVTAVGVNSINGRILMSLDVEPEVTPLQARLNSLAEHISIYGSVIALILFIILFIKFLSSLPSGGRFHNLSSAEKGSKFMDLVITTVTIIVVAIPEGLPLAVTLSLAFATTRMSKDGNLVRVFKACETMGSVTAVCSDKTGTLTENRMTVVKGSLGSSLFDDTLGDSSKTATKVVEQELTESIKNDILTNIALNSTAFENKQESLAIESLSIPTLTPDFQKTQEEELFVGSKTEVALLLLAKTALGMSSLQSLRADTSLLGVESIVQVIPFESTRKWGGIVVKMKDSKKFRFYIKGAVESILERCQYKRLSDSTYVRISPSIYQEEKDLILQYAPQSLRVISLAHKDFEDIESWPPEDLKDISDPSVASPELLYGDICIPADDGKPEIITNGRRGLVLDGFVGIHDPLRKNVKESVNQCKRSGVTVRMVTGDNLLTAKAIARECGILEDDEYGNPLCSMEGIDFRKLSVSEKMGILPKLRVLARSSPEDKRVLVETLKKMGELVAVTGDGTNDAPALKLADIGFSMGIAGTEVAREASDIILMKDDFGAIVSAIKWGRCINVSIKKFIQFQLTVNITAVVLTFVSAVSSADERSVLTAVQLLWVNLIMDTLAALALATDKPDDKILNRKPKGREAPVIPVSSWKMILGQAVLQLIIGLTLHYAGERIFFNERVVADYHKKQISALVFNTFVWLQFFKLLVSRKLDEADGISSWKKRITLNNLNFFEDITRNNYFLAIILVIGGSQILIMFFGGDAFSIAHQTRGMWATAIICGMTALPVGVLLRICPDEWALAIFPSRLCRAIRYVIELEFLRRKKGGKDDDEESLLIEGKGHISNNYSKIAGSSAFERAKTDVLFHKEHFKEHESSYLNPFTFIRRWKSSQESLYSTHDEHSLIASLTMVPTLVGGAVAGFSQISSVDAKPSHKNAAEAIIPPENKS